MTKEEILAMEAGPELNALVAVYVEGWMQLDKHPGPNVPQAMLSPHTGKTVEPYNGPWYYPPGFSLQGNGVEPPNYSTDIAAAFWAAEKMADCLHLRQYGEQGIWEASFCGYPGIKGHGESAPLAICRAALLTKLNN